MDTHDELVRVKKALSEITEKLDREVEHSIEDPEEAHSLADSLLLDAIDLLASDPIYSLSFLLQDISRKYRLVKKWYG